MPITLLESVGVLLAGEILLLKIMPQAAHLTYPGTVIVPPGYTPLPPPTIPVPRSNIVPTSMQVALPDNIKLLDEQIAPDVPVGYRQCKSIIGSGYQPLSDTQILDLVKPPSSRTWQDFFGGSGASPLRRQLFEHLKQAVATEQIPFNALSCKGQSSSQGKSKFYTNANQALSGLNTINANVLKGTNKLEGAAVLGVASIVLGFEEDGVLGGIANSLQVVAKFDPEPISRTILTVVGQMFGSIFAHHRERVKVEQAVSCATVPAITESLYSLEQAVLDGRIYPEHGSQLLDRLYDEFTQHLNSYGLIKRTFGGLGTNAWACNAGCELLWYLQAIIVKKKDRFAHLTNVPCQGPPPVSIQAPVVYVNPAIAIRNETAVDSIPAARPAPTPAATAPARPVLDARTAALYRLAGGRLA